MGYLKEKKYRKQNAKHSSRQIKIIMHEITVAYRSLLSRKLSGWLLSFFQEKESDKHFLIKITLLLFFSLDRKEPKDQGRHERSAHSSVPAPPSVWLVLFDNWLVEFW